MSNSVSSLSHFFLPLFAAVGSFFFFVFCPPTAVSFFPSTPLYNSLSLTLFLSFFFLRSPFFFSSCVCKKREEKRHCCILHWKETHRYRLKKKKRKKKELGWCWAGNGGRGKTKVWNRFDARGPTSVTTQRGLCLFVKNYINEVWLSLQVAGKRVVLFLFLFSFSFFFFSLENESLIVEPALFFCFSFLFCFCFAFLCSPSPTTLVSLDCHNYGATLTSEISCFFCLRHLLGSHQHILLGKPIFFLHFFFLLWKPWLISSYYWLFFFFPLCVRACVLLQLFCGSPQSHTRVSFFFFFFLRYGDCSRGRKFEVRQRPKADTRPFFLWIFCFFFFFFLY